MARYYNRYCMSNLVFSPSDKIYSTKLYRLCLVVLIVRFINYVILETDKEEEHEKIVKKVVKKLEKKNLYIKLEKYKQIVREFLKVVIRLDGINIEEEKMKAILDWLAPKGVKDIQKFLGLVNYYQQFIKDFAKLTILIHELVRKVQAKRGI